MYIHVEGALYTYLLVYLELGEFQEELSLPLACLNVWFPLIHSTTQLLTYFVHSGTFSNRTWGLHEL